MIKELPVILFLSLVTLAGSPQIGMILSIIGVLILIGLPIAASVVLLVPSLRSKFLSS